VLFIWEMEHRQPRGVASQLTYLGQQYRVGVPFYDRRLFAAWMAIPPMGLHDKQLLRWTLWNRFPEVAAISHSEEAPTRLPNSALSLRHLVGLLTIRARDSVLRRVLPGHDKRAGRRYSWGLWHQRSFQQAERQLAVLAEKRASVVDLLDWAPEETGGTEFWNRVAERPREAERIRTSYFLLAEYCDWLKRTIPGI
jgi:hypothetical protein